MGSFDDHTLRILYILVVSVIVWAAVQVLTKSFVVSISVGAAKGKRLRTLTNLVKSAASVVIVSVGFVMVLQEVGFNIAPLIASAGIAGLAIGFGAQSLVKDVIAGFFILVEDQLDEGDEVEISGKKGVIKKITLRTIWLKDKDGTLHVVPNGSITIVSNFSKNKN